MLYSREWFIICSENNVLCCSEIKNLLCLLEWEVIHIYVYLDRNSSFD